MLAMISVAPSIIPELCRFIEEAWISQDGLPSSFFLASGQQNILVDILLPSGNSVCPVGLCA